MPSLSHCRDTASSETHPAIIVFPGGWGDMLTDWLKTAITLERMMGDMKALKGEEPTGTDVEACAYLNTASMIVPMDSDWSQIYLYVAGKTYTRWTKAGMSCFFSNKSSESFLIG